MATSFCPVEGIAIAYVPLCGCVSLLYARYWQFTIIHMLGISRLCRRMDSMNPTSSPPAAWSVGLRGGDLNLAKWSIFPYCSGFSLLFG